MNDTKLIGESACLIGHTGFVGATLARQASFSAQFNSTNIVGIAGQSFDTVLCAAAPGSMFAANTFPDTDQKAIQTLIDSLSTVKAKNFILISSIAVFSNPVDGNDETSSAFENRLAYGRHRRALEAFVEEQFEKSLIVRLPALFGHGLRKNFIFDLLNPVPSMLTKEKWENLITVLDEPLAIWVRKLYVQTNGMFKLDRTALDADRRREALDDAVIRLGCSAIQFHNLETTYQYYDMCRLWSDIQIALQAGLSHIHLAPEPLKAACIYERLTGRMMPQTEVQLHNEDMQTCHTALWGRTGRYIDDSESILAGLTEFFHAERYVS